MMNETLYTRALRQAVHRLGSRQSLAEHLGVRDGELIRWLTGVEPPPESVRDALKQLLKAA